MDSEQRQECADLFEKIANKISELSNELTDNKDVHEFLKEMEKHKQSLEREIEWFKKQI